MLIEAVADSNCRASVIIPARNEEAALPAALDALGAQLDLAGRPLANDSFELLLLLNNCTDRSLEVARCWQARHPQVRLHIIERTIPQEIAHAGTARRLLMDTAWRRLRTRAEGEAVMLSTDADTIVAPDWIAQNLRAIEEGADAVGGAIRLKAGDLESLPAGVRRSYERDRRYQRLVAHVEDRLDPQTGDPRPRHLDHFGASLACTPQIYARAGGMPACPGPEDVAFVDALRRAGARLRHEPAVVVYTSARLDGRAEVGLSSQLREWQRISVEQRPHRVLSCNWLVHRFQELRRLRALHAESTLTSLSHYPVAWRRRLAQAHRQRSSEPQFLAEIDCDRLIEETFFGDREGEIKRVNRDLARLLRDGASRGRYSRMPPPSFEASLNQSAIGD